MRAALGFRVVRAAVFAVVCVAVSAAGHVLSGHEPVTAPALAAGFGLAVALGAVLAGRERSLATILAAMLTGEAGLHSLFCALGPERVAHAATMTAGASMPAGHPMVMHSGFTMVLAHAWAGLLAAWWLHRGERAAWSLLRRLGARLLPRLLPPATVTAPPWAPAAVRAATPHARRIRYSLVQRGPPVTA